MRALVAIFVIALAHTQHASAQVETTIPTICPSQCVATLSPLVKKVAPSVVNIAIKGRVAEEQNPLFNGPFFRRFFNLPELPAEREIRAASSGVIVDPSHRLVITNNHVAEHADEIAVTLSDGSAATAPWHHLRLEGRSA